MPESVSVRGAARDRAGAELEPSQGLPTGLLGIRCTCLPLRQSTWSAGGAALATRRGRQQAVGSRSAEELSAASRCWRYLRASRSGLAAANET